MMANKEKVSEDYYNNIGRNGCPKLTHRRTCLASRIIGETPRKEIGSVESRPTKDSRVLSYVVRHRLGNSHSTLAAAVFHLEAQISIASYTPFRVQLRG